MLGEDSIDRFVLTRWFTGILMLPGTNCFAQG